MTAGSKPGLRLRRPCWHTEGDDLGSVPERTDIIHQATGAVADTLFQDSGPAASTSTACPEPLALPCGATSLADGKGCRVVDFRTHQGESFPGGQSRASVRDPWFMAIAAHRYKNESRHPDACLWQARREGK